MANGLEQGLSLSGVPRFTNQTLEERRILASGGVPEPEVQPDIRAGGDAARDYINESIEELEAEHLKKLEKRDAILSDAAKMKAPHSETIQFLKSQGLDDIKEPEGLSSFRKTKTDLLKRERRIVTGADGFQYYADTQERVLPEAVKPPTEKERIAESKAGAVEEELLSKAKIISAKSREAIAQINELGFGPTGILRKVSSSLGGPKGIGTTGLIGSALANIPGSDAFDLERKIDTIKANLGFEELKAMKRASPTGGALGQVTEREIEFLQSTIASLDIGQSEEQIRQSLTEIAELYEDIVRKIEQGMSDMINQEAGGEVTTATGGGQLDATTAQQFLAQAGGDKDEARRLAREAGFTF